jgi:hypothetical protein
MKVVAACLLALLSSAANGQQWWSFESHPYYDPLIAGVREPQFSALVPAHFKRMAMMVSDKRTRTGWDIDVGAELPIFGRESEGTAGKIGEGNGAGDYGFRSTFT